MKIRLAAAGAAAAAVASAALVLAGCSSVQPSIGQYGVVTAHGAFSSGQGITEVADPGQKLYASGTDWYMPSDARNYVTSPTNGDRNNPQAENTGSQGSSPGMPDYTWSYLTFELNPNHNVIKKFFPFCVKFPCASNTPQAENTAQQTRSSFWGWRAMLGEVMPRAIDNATRDVITTYGPGLWNDRAEWNTYGDKIAAALPAELAKLDGSGTDPNQDFFCGPGSTPSHCAPFTLVIQNVTPVDPGVVTAYNQKVTATYQQQAAAARLQAAKGVYGADANYFLGLLDLIHSAQAGKTPINIYVGNPPVHP